MNTKSLAFAIFTISALATPLVFASINGLPPSRAHLEESIEKAHAQGVEDFFTATGEDCESWEIQNQDYLSSPATSLVPELFRVESRVLASCLRQEIYFCHSSFTEDGTYRYTDCEVDTPLHDE